MTYNIGFDVQVTTRFAAIAGAVLLLRTGVKYVAVHSAEETAPGLWHVVLNVYEDV